MKQNELNLSR